MRSLSRMRRGRKVSAPRAHVRPRVTEDAAGSRRYRAQSMRDGRTNPDWRVKPEQEPRHDNHDPERDHDIAHGSAVRPQGLPVELATASRDR
jgi:hypothetical protein